ncbi:MAG: hypothetical protein GF409_01550 [Candidatus Omnitrophica bacterium]|nr:hypothetical protein [Candidatus Omnitrophota bacterium]
MGDIDLRKKFTFKIRDKKIVLIKKSHETFAHVAGKILCYALYYPFYPDLQIEMRIGERYKPDLVMLDVRGKPVFWGECGAVGKQKIYKILHKFTNTHFSFIKITKGVKQFRELVLEQRRKASHKGIVDIVSFPEEVTERLTDEYLSRVKLKDHLAYRMEGEL